jgi:hypothetical protein
MGVRFTWDTGRIGKAFGFIELDGEKIELLKRIDLADMGRSVLRPYHGASRGFAIGLGLKVR